MSNINESTDYGCVNFFFFLISPNFIDQRGKKEVELLELNRGN